MRSGAARIGIFAVLTVVVIGLAAFAWLLSRQPVRATSQANGNITIECSAASGASAGACREWGDAILADDPAPHTFERKDLNRLLIDRSMLGFGGDCRVAFYISRDADEPVWSGATACR